MDFADWCWPSASSPPQSCPRTSIDQQDMNSPHFLSDKSFLTCVLCVRPAVGRLFCVSTHSAVLSGLHTQLGHSHPPCRGPPWLQRRRGGRRSTKREEALALPALWALSLCRLSFHLSLPHLKSNRPISATPPVLRRGSQLVGLVPPRIVALWRRRWCIRGELAEE